MTDPDDWTGWPPEAVEAGQGVSLDRTEGEGSHFYVCQGCGQAVDMRDLGAVLRHDQPGHEPDALQ